jgi:hypothetical protein
MKRRWDFHGSWGGGWIIERGPWSLNWRYNLHELILGVRIAVCKTWTSDWHYVVFEVGAGSLHVRLIYAKNPKRYSV